jgi:lysozyme
MNIKNRDNVYEQLKIDEGVIYGVYKDPLGHLTFGIGHLITRDDDEDGLPEGYDVSEERIYEAFQDDLDTAISECEILFEACWNNFPAELQEVLVNMMFNLGRRGLGKFKKFINHLENHHWPLAALEMLDSRWARQVGNRAIRLSDRVAKL